jgi:ubiquinone/menaquinone biosynthesis C-methylase UbiE
MIPEEFICKLRCPVSKKPLRLIGRDKAMQIAKGFSGSEALHQWDEALTTEDESILFPVKHGIMCLLPKLGISALAPTSAPVNGAEVIKEQVRGFYDDLGWSKNDGAFADAVIYEDLRDVATDYVHRCHLRVMEHLPKSGRYLLDVASGPIQYDEYLRYSDGHERRVCVDISFRALVEAQKRLGDKGIYLVADVTCLPVADDTFEGVVSLHTIYHVPSTQQETAFHEIYRVLAPGNTAAVIYSWGRHSLLMLLFFLPFWAWSWLSKRLARKFLQHSEAGVAETALYGHHYGYRWFAARNWPFSYALFSWRSLSPDFTKTYIRSWLFGRAFLRIVFHLENIWPRLLGRIGQYPLIVISK